MCRTLILIALFSATTVGCSVDVLAPFRAPPDVSISVESARARPYHATIVWNVEHASTAPYLIERRYALEPWKPLTHLYVESGRISLEDLSVQPGATYSYRVRIGRDKGAAAAGEVTVQVPK